MVVVGDHLPVIVVVDMVEAVAEEAAVGVDLVSHVILNLEVCVLLECITWLNKIEICLTNVFQ